MEKENKHRCRGCGLIVEGEGRFHFSTEDCRKALRVVRDQLVEALKETTRWIAQNFTTSQASVHADGPCGQNFCIYCNAVEQYKTAKEK